MIGVVLLIILFDDDDIESDGDMMRLNQELKTLDLSLQRVWNISNEDIVVATKFSSCDVVEVEDNDDDGVCIIFP